VASGVDRQQRTSRQSRTSASRSGRADVPQSGLLRPSLQSKAGEISPDQRRVKNWARFGAPYMPPQPFSCHVVLLSEFTEEQM
jgi:hypothetical protein